MSNFCIKGISIKFTDAYGHIGVFLLSEYLSANLPDVHAGGGRSFKINSFQTIRIPFADISLKGLSIQYLTKCEIIFDQSYMGTLYFDDFEISH